MATNHNVQGKMVLMNARQMASSLIQAINTFYGVSTAGAQDRLIDVSKLHFHDDSSAGIAWNDVQTIQKFNAVTNKNLPVPLTATQGYNQHYHTSEYDGGWIAGRGIHDHRDNFNGGFAFAVFHPGTQIPQQPWFI